MSLKEREMCDVTDYGKAMALICHINKSYISSEISIIVYGSDLSYK